MIKLVKPFRIGVREGEPYESSIISIMWQDWLQENDIIVQKKYHVYINLWLVELFFEFLSRRKHL